VLDTVSGDCLEILAEIEPRDASQVGLRVRRSPDAAEQTTIVYDPAAGTLSVDTSRSSLGGDVVQPWPCPWGVMYDNPLEPRVLPFHDAPVPIEDVRVQPAPLQLVPGEPLRLHVFLDRSILEVFANDRQCITQRIYPSRADSLGVAAFAVGGEAPVRSIRAWRLAPAGV
jgi:sucrose-6-phosphate hydrolase SacC (GH32 family)